MSNFGHPVNESYLDTLVSTLSNGGMAGHSFHVEYLDLDRPMRASERQQHAAFLVEKYANMDVGLIFCAGQPALNFLLNDIAEVAPEAPALVWNAEVPAPALTGQRYLIAQMSRLDYRGTLQRALELFPKTERVIVIQGNSEQERSRREFIRSELAPWQDTLQIEHTYGLSAAEIEAKLAVAPDNTVVMGVGVTKDAKGQLFVPAQFLERVLRSARVPLFVLFEQNVKLGAVGGMVSITRDDAMLMANHALGLLRGTTRPAEPVTILQSVSVPVFDWRQLEYWGAETSALPANTVFINRPLPLWTEHKGKVIAATIAFLVLGSLIVLLLTLGRLQQRTNVALQESRKQYRTLVEETADLITRVDADGYFTFVNHAAQEIFGLAPEQCRGRLAFDFIHPEDRSATEAAFQSWIFSEATFFTHENRQVGVDGRLHHMAWSMRKELDGTGKVIGFAGTARDITARKLAEEENRKLQLQLQQAQKIESVGRLAGGVAHDFNNMLTVILGHAELGLKRLDENHPVREDLKTICQTAERSADLTRQLLAFARRQTIAPVALNLNETISAMIKMLRRLIGEDIHLTWKPAPDLWQVKMDPSQVDQILANLCVNARDAITDTGQITIETENRSIDSDDCDASPEAKPGQYVMLRVSDDGIGMDEKTQLRIFEPFYTTKDLGKGTGLGLATVYGAVRQNNGFIKFYSEPGRGTTFSVYVPRHEDDDVLPSPLELPAPTAPLGRETILLVEDEPAILNLVAQMLETQGYAVLKAASPGEALRLAHEQAEIRLLVTDTVMPEMNGRDLAKILQASYPHLECLFMSGYTADVIAHHGVLEDGVHFIQKPFTLPNLAAKVREVLDHRNG